MPKTTEPPIEIPEYSPEPMAWAASLTAHQLAHQMRRLVADVHVLSSEERRAVLTIAADELERTP